MAVFSIKANLLPKSDSRYKKWRESLKKRPPPWNKGFTKINHLSVAKMVRTFKKKKIDNFRNWREGMRRVGKIPATYPPFQKDGNLAELIGVILGDGNISNFPRTEELRIVSNSSNKGFIKRYASLIYKTIGKEPKIRKDKYANCVRIIIYQKKISKRLGIPTGARGKINIKIPRWIFSNKEYLQRYLRGLYEAEGSFCVHKPTYTYKFLFANRNKSLLKNVYQSLRKLGFHPHNSKDKIQISKQNEVYKIKDLIKFRQY